MSAANNRTKNELGAFKESVVYQKADEAAAIKTGGNRQTVAPIHSPLRGAHFISPLMAARKMGTKIQPNRI